MAKRLAEPKTKKRYRRRIKQFQETNCIECGTIVTVMHIMKNSHRCDECKNQHTYRLRRMTEKDYELMNTI
jgi:hypothetical protein